MTPATEREPPDKATLHCPDCGHGSPVDGDWLVQVRAGLTVRECPNCGSTIESRRTRGVLIAGSGGPTHPAPER